eukprot:scaffold4612_cov155-Skeletonema_dohrnii-CCMP3373.AAC.1
MYIGLNLELQHYAHRSKRHDTSLLPRRFHNGLSLMSGASRMGPFKKTPNYSPVESDHDHPEPEECELQHPGYNGGATTNRLLSRRIFPVFLSGKRW